MKYLASLILSTLLMGEAKLARATSLVTPPKHMTIGMLQLFCVNDIRSKDRYGNGYCDGYLKSVIDSYFEVVRAKRARIKKNACLIFPTNDWLSDEIRDEILAISETRTLDLDHGTRAQPWITARLVAKCGPTK